MPEAAPVLRLHREHIDGVVGLVEIGREDAIPLHLAEVVFVRAEARHVVEQGGLQILARRAQRLPASVEDRPSGHGRLAAASPTVPKPPLGRPRIRVPAGGTHKPTRPPQGGKIAQARLLRGEALFELDQVVGILIHKPRHYM